MRGLIASGVTVALLAAAAMTVACAGQVLTDPTPSSTSTATAVAITATSPAPSTAPTIPVAPATATLQNTVPLATAAPATPVGTLPPPSPSSQNTPQPSQITIGLADNGKTVSLVEGQTALLSLGSDYDWTVSVDDQSILSRIPNITVIRGAQGVYRAIKTGTTALSASGSVICPPDKMCIATVKDFRVVVLVK